MAAGFAYPVSSVMFQNSSAKTGCARGEGLRGDRT